MIKKEFFGIFHPVRPPSKNNERSIAGDIDMFLNGVKLTNIFFCTAHNLRSVLNIARPSRPVRKIPIMESRVTKILLKLTYGHLCLLQIHFIWLGIVLAKFQLVNIKTLALASQPMT